MRLIPSLQETAQVAAGMSFSSGGDRITACLLARLMACKAQVRLVREVERQLEQEMAAVTEQLKDICEPLTPENN